MHKEVFNGAIRWVPNTLADLTRREYRYAHVYDLTTSLDPSLHGFPHVLDLSGQQSGINRGDLMNRENIVLTDALAFDVRAFDPGAPLYETAGVVVDPCDPGWQTVVGAGTPVGFGAYVDLGWNQAGTYNYGSIPNSPPTLFQEERRVGWNPRFPAQNLGGVATYDTWTWHYENDGLDQDNRDNDYVANTGAGSNTGADEGTNSATTKKPQAPAATPTASTTSANAKPRPRIPSPCAA